MDFLQDARESLDNLRVSDASRYVFVEVRLACAQSSHKYLING